MKRKLLLALPIAIASLQLTHAQNVGIGNDAPLMRLHVTKEDSAVAIFENSQTLGTDVNTGIYFKTGSGTWPYTGSIRTIGTTTNTARLGFFTYTSTTPGALLERMSITDGGNVGIGTTAPGIGKLEVTGSYSTSQLIVTSGFNQTGISTAVPLNISPSLSFNMYYANAFRYMTPGFGGNIQLSPSTGTLYFSISQRGANAGDAAFFNNASMALDSIGQLGVGGIAPTHPLDVNGRMLLRYKSGTAGINFNNQANSGVAQFFGNYNDTIAGIYTYGGGGWQFMFDHKNGRLGLNLANPKVPLSFPASLGKKISLYPGATGDAGFDVFGNELRIHSDVVNADITFGYDTYNAAFTERMRIKGSGAVCIGTTQVATGYILNIGGKAIAEEVKVQLRGSWPDYVFHKDYQLRSLPDLENYIQENNHLPNIPAAAEVEKSGISLGEMQKNLVEKVEELSLYIIDLQKQITNLKAAVNEKK